MAPNKSLEGQWTVKQKHQSTCHLWALTEISHHFPNRVWRVFSGSGIWPKYCAGFGKMQNFLSGKEILQLARKRDLQKFSDGMWDFCASLLGIREIVRFSINKGCVKCCPSFQTRSRLPIQTKLTMLVPAVHRGKDTAHKTLETRYNARAWRKGRAVQTD